MQRHDGDRYVKRFRCRDQLIAMLCVQLAGARSLRELQAGFNGRIEAGTTYVFDKGYCNYNWWHSIDQKGAIFVTRFKRDAALTFKRERRPNGQSDILRDSVVAFSLRIPRGGHRNSYSKPLRRIEMRRPDEASLVLATNDMHSPAEDIALLQEALGHRTVVQVGQAAPADPPVRGTK